MKNIIILVGKYPPDISASSNISYNIAQELKKEGHNVIVITRKNSYNLKKNEIINGTYIYRINDWNQIIHNECINRITKKQTFFKVVLFVKRVIFFIPKIFRMQSFSRRYVKKIYKKLKYVDKKVKIDAIIPISSPHEEIFAATYFKRKNKNLKLLPYQLDRFSNGDRLYATNFLKNIKYRNNIKLEKKVLKLCDRLFVLPPIYPHYKDNTEFQHYINKIEITEHPLIKKTGKNNIENKGTIDILYAGALYKQLRNPIYLFKLLDTQIIDKSNMRMHLYAFGDCQNIINQYCSRLKGVIYDHGKIRHDILISKMKEANILLSIGNNSDNELPSKLFEYLSMCKPIIHLYYSDKDAYLEYLKNYEYAICIKMDENKIEENRKLFYDFCNKNSKVNIDYEVVEKKFIKCTPKYVTKKFINQIEEKLY